MNDATQHPGGEGAPGTPSPLVVHGALVAVQLGFASHHVVSKVAVAEVPPGALAFVRASSAALIMLAIHLARRGLPRVPVRDLPKLAGAALLGIAGNQLLFFHGLSRTRATNASVLVTTIPVFTLVATLVLGREKATWRGIGGVAVALSGVLYLVGVEALTVGVETIAGDAMIVANAACYGTYLVVVTNLVKRHGSMTAVVWLFTFGALWVAPFGVPDLLTTAPRLAPAIWAAVAWVVLVATVFTYLVNAWALRYAPASVVAIYIYLQPVAATALAVTFLDEPVTARLLVAALLVFAGIFLVTRRPRDRGDARTDG
ncbi:MAG TPA: DMT family transporter [Sandaracinaceae bacterium LLY-WYZ-13_1]|nr:DMT family transporter [Sandaracinaceae bacterium LLY-WYZ-13_1]